MEEITTLYITLVVFVVLYPKMKVALAKFAWELERHKRNKPAWGEDVTTNNKLDQFISWRNYHEIL